jgi:hypothetical protein
VRLDRVEILAQQVLDEGELDALRVGRVADDRRDPIEPACRAARQRRSPAIS